MTSIKSLEIVQAKQELYDAFNSFILSSDTKIFGKLMARCLLLDHVKDVPGDIVECGVFKGTGILTFLKAKRFLCPNSIKKVVGFDFYDTDSLLNSLSGQDKEAMTTLFRDRGFDHREGFVSYLNGLIEDCGFSDYEFELVKGDVSTTTLEYSRSNPGLRISLLYLDLDVEKPTYDSLSNLWDHVSEGGLIVFDEYAYQKWSEANGADNFFKDKGVRIKTLNFMAPTAYVIKGGGVFPCESKTNTSGLRNG